ncbi:MAG: T9SS type A sorting domain-containing protein [Saprospiraceae bacterium]
MKYLILVFTLCFSFSLFAQTLHLVKPSDTDAGITTDDQNHWVYLNQDVTPKNKLFVFLPGTFAFPALYSRVLKTAANLGYHSIGLNYPNPLPINTICGISTDTTCHGRARQEVIDGIDRHLAVNVTQPNSIENRLIKVLQYLDDEFPNENWGQYWTGDSTIIWESIVMSGHSQGGGHAAILGKLRPLERVVIFASLDWMNTLDRIPSWVTMDGVTSSDKYFAFTHDEDEALDFDQQQIFWEGLGMNPTDNLILVDDTFSPFQNSQTLFTQITPAADSQFHSCIVVDVATPKDVNGVPVLETVWEYLIDFPLSTSIVNNAREDFRFKVFPNPATERIWINSITERQEPTQIEMYNSYGQQVNSFIMNGNMKSYSLDDYPVGMYFLVFKNRNKKSVVKFMKL